LTQTLFCQHLFGGLPRRALRYHRGGYCRFFVSQFLLDELLQVLNYPKFAQRLTDYKHTPEKILAEYISITTLVDTSTVELPNICRDPDDNHVLACAEAGQAILVVSGDSDLLSLGDYKGIRILSVADFVALIDRESGDA
jgi:putative PIN family toxin of toxin-antitoxin system